MALLTNTDLRKIISSNIEEADSFKLIIAPYDEGGLTPVGYDLRVGKEHVVNGLSRDLSENESLAILPKSLALIRTLEEIRMPKNKGLSAIISSKVSLSCKGLSNISTTIDADWKGSLLIAVHNNSNKEIELSYGEAFCTVLFIENKSSATEGRYAKPDGRSDILKEQFKQSTKANLFASIVANLLPPFTAVLSLILAYSLFGDDETWVAAIVAVGVFVATFMMKFVDPLIAFWVSKKK